MLKKASFCLMLFSAVTVSAQDRYVWQHNDISDAWRQGYKGQGVTIHIHDNFSGEQMKAISNARSWGESIFIPNFRTTTHGEAVATVAGHTAPLAAIEKKQWNNNNIQLKQGGLNIVNVSYDTRTTRVMTPAQIVNSRNAVQVSRIAHEGTALVVKAAGNDNRSLSDNGAGLLLNNTLKNADAVIFAGALENHGTPVNKHQVLFFEFTTGGVRKASYSNTPGHDPVYQRQFLMVGVPSNMDAAGTSFAAPQIAAYAAIVGSKFKKSTPSAVAAQLLTTARTDTILDYNARVHGRGEASLSRALAPKSIR